MKAIKNAILIILFLIIKHPVEAQGFVNLNFESANVSGFQPESIVPISSALPGWSGFYGSDPTSQVLYDVISLDAAMISLIDNNALFFGPLQGNYSAFLFGGTDGVSSSISQTGTIPIGTESLRMDAWSYGASPIVAINGQPINMVPLQTFANYTLYGGDISSYSGLVTLSFTEPPPLTVTGGASQFELDNILFSTTVLTPEPGIVALTAIGGLLFGARKRFARP